MPVPEPIQSAKSKPTPAQLAHRAKLAEYGRKGGLRKKPPRSLNIPDEGQAFESIKAKWNYISHKLADEASKVARNPQKIDGRSLVALTTAAGIAYDKRWKNQTSADTEIDIPGTLAVAIASKCAIKADVSVPMQDRDSIQSDTDKPIDPLLLSPGL